MTLFGKHPIRRGRQHCRYNRQMKTASISVAKNQLCALIEQLRLGKTILLTEHARPLARIIPDAADRQRAPSRTAPVHCVPSIRCSWRRHCLPVSTDR